MVYKTCEAGENLPTGRQAPAWVCAGRGCGFVIIGTPAAEEKNYLTDWFPKGKKLAIIAVANKLIKQVFGIIKNECLFDRNY